MSSALPIEDVVLDSHLAGGLEELPLVRVVIVDDFVPLRNYICELLRDESEMEIVHLSPDGLDAVLKCEELQPDLVVMDISLPKLNGLEAARQIRARSPRTKIVFLSMHDEPAVIQEALVIGAAYVLKRNAGTDLLPAVHAALRDEPFVRFRFLGEDPGEPSEV